jgi:hypothetical protein
MEGEGKGREGKGGEKGKGKGERGEEDQGLLGNIPSSYYPFLFAGGFVLVLRGYGRD